MSSSAARHSCAQASALAAARLLDRVDSLPAGLATPVRERGARVSGGQRRRLVLARALLADFPILVLDEPTEDLEHDTAAAITADLLAATAGRTGQHALGCRHLVGATRRAIGGRTGARLPTDKIAARLREVLENSTLCALILILGLVSGRRTGNRPQWSDLTRPYRPDAATERLGRPGMARRGTSRGFRRPR
jgi:hypothetical protein